MALTTINVPRKISPESHNSRVPHPLAASTKSYIGAMAGLTAGYARNLVAGDKFAGFFDEEVDNTSGSAGDKLVQIIRNGIVRLTAITGASLQANIGDIVYASSNNDFTLTSTNNSAIGRIIAWDAANSEFIVYFSAHAYNQAT